MTHYYVSIIVFLNFKNSRLFKPWKVENWESKKYEDYDGKNIIFCVF